MFADAYEKAAHFTHPLIISTRHWDGTVKCAGGAFVILNREGWVITAAHLIQSFGAFSQHQKEIASYETQIEKLRQDSRLSSQQKARQRKKLRANPGWMTNCSLWWGRDNVSVTGMRVFHELDIAIGKLEPFDTGTIAKYPVIKAPETLRPGTALCKLGFPFHNLSATFDQATSGFKLAPGSLPVPRFPIEGIYTRNCLVGKTQDGKYDRMFLETSTPGLRGQSGGPVFDKDGVVWGIQSHTLHFPLGFNPKVVDSRGREVEENQFLNAGMAIHPKVLTAVLDEMAVPYDKSDY